MPIKHWIALGTIASLLSATSAYAQAPAPTQARVMSAIPVLQQVSVPQQYCSDETIQTAPRTTGTGAVVGAIIGGIAGSALGGGHRPHGPGPHGGYYYGPSRGATTALGAIAGGVIGHQVESANSVPSTETVRRCSTQNTYQNQVIGYDVTYEYAGHRYTTRMDHDPGPWMTVNVQPSSAAAPSRFVGPSGEYQPSPYTVINNETIIYGDPPPPPGWRY